MAREKASKTDNYVDPKLKKTFIEMRDQWSSLDQRAKSAAGKRRQYEKEIKEAGFSKQQIKISLLLQTPEGEAEFKAEMANRMLAAAYSDADIGDQLSLFLDVSRTPAIDRAYKEGQTAAMKNESLNPPYDPDTEQFKAFSEGYHDEQGRQVKAGIGKLDAKKAAANKAGTNRKGTKKAAPATGKRRGRPPKAAQAPETAPETRLITKAEKEAKAQAAAQKADSGPPRRPAAAPITRASLKAQREQARDEAESYFTKAEPAGNA